MCYYGGLSCVLPPLVEIGAAFLLSFVIFILIHRPCRRASRKARAGLINARVPEAKCGGSSSPRELAAKSRPNQPGRRASSASSSAEDKRLYSGCIFSSDSSIPESIPSQMNSRQMPTGLRRSMSMVVTSVEDDEAPAMRRHGSQPLRPAHTFQRASNMTHPKQNTISTFRRISDKKFSEVNPQRVRTTAKPARACAARYALAIMGRVWVVLACRISGARQGIVGAFSDSSKS